MTGDSDSSPMDHSLDAPGQKQADNVGQIQSVRSVGVSTQHLQEEELKLCYGVESSALQAWEQENPAGATEFITIALPNGRTLDYTVLLDEPVGGLMMKLHLEHPDEIPPPMAASLTFADVTVSMSESLREHGVTEGACMELRAR